MIEHTELVHTCRATHAKVVFQKMLVINTIKYNIIIRTVHVHIPGGVLLW